MQTIDEDKQLKDLCKWVKKEIEQQEYEIPGESVIQSMNRYPHSAIPHNLLGIILEAKRDHAMAMRHFRAAYALDPSYRPSCYNMNLYGNAPYTGKAAYDDNEGRFLQ